MRPTIRPLLYSLLLLTCAIACEVVPCEEPDDPEAGGDSDSDTGEPATIDNDRPLRGEPLSHREWGDVGLAFGPCGHEEPFRSGWCKQPEGSGPVVCLTPQENGQSHASVCAERRDECPPFKLVEVDGVLVEHPVGQDFGTHGCVLKCNAELACPEAMICTTGICAWETEL